MALYLLRRNVNRENPDEIGEACQGAEISIEYKNGEQIVLLNGENVNPFLRKEEVGNMASVSSANPKVREKLLTFRGSLRVHERGYGRKRYRHYHPSQCRGEDLSDCQLSYKSKAPLSGAPGKRLCCDLEEIRKDIEERDSRDMNREISPLKLAEDAVLVDSSEMTIEEVVKRILQIFHEK